MDCFKKTLVFMLFFTSTVFAQKNTKLSKKAEIIRSELLELSNQSLPFNELLKRMATKIHEVYEVNGQVTVNVQELDGRSLQAKYDNFEFPRKSVMFEVDGIFIPVKLGYAPLANEIEAQLFDAKGDYLFAVVSKYGPKIKNDSKLVMDSQIQSLCMGCHQGGAAIFSHFPWSESTSRINSTTEVSNALSEARSRARTNNPELVKFSSLKNESSDKFRIATSNVFGFDSLVRMANKGAQTSRVCLDICKGNNECQKLVSLIAFANERDVFEERPSLSEFKSNVIINGKSAIVESNDFELSPLEQSLKGSISNFPKHGYAYRSSVLPDMDPSTLKGRILKSTHSNIKNCNNGNDPDCNYPTFADFNATIDTSSQAGISITGLDDLRLKDGSLFPNPLKPSTPRPLISKLTLEDAIFRVSSLGLSYCLGISKAERNKILGSFSSLKNFSRQIYENEELANVFTTYPLDVEKFLSLSGTGSEGELCVACELQENLTYLKPTTSEIEDIVAFVKRGAVISDHEIVEMFSKYCSDCHTGSSFGPNLPIDTSNPKASVENMLTYKNGEVVRRLQTDMPMHDSSEQRNIDKSGDRAKLINALKTHPKYKKE